MKKILYIITNNLDEYIGIELRRDREGIFLHNGYYPFEKINNIQTIGLINAEFIKFIK